MKKIRIRTVLFFTRRTAPASTAIIFLVELNRKKDHSVFNFAEKVYSPVPEKPFICGLC